MAKIPRKHQKVFAGGAANNGQFGSAQVGTKVTTTDLDTIQALAAWGAGWDSATISSQRLPTLEEMQALHYVTTTQIAYLFQEGIPEYDSATEYNANSIVKKAGTYELYGSKIILNTGNALPAAVDDANWKYLGDLSNLNNTGGGAYESAGQALVSGGGITLPHGLGAAPDLITLELECIVADDGYSIGDRIPIAPNNVGDVTARGVAITNYDATNIYLRYSDQAQPLQLLDAGTGTFRATTVSSYELIVKARVF